MNPDYDVAAWDIKGHPTLEAARAHTEERVPTLDLWWRRLMLSMR